MILDETNTLANAIYIYLIILFTGIITGSVLALFKEYMSSDNQIPDDLEKACNSLTESERSEFSLSNADNSEVPPSSTNHKLKSERSTISYLKRLKSKKSSNSNSRSISQNDDKNTTPAPIDEPGLELEHESLGSQPKERIKYTMQELIEIQTKGIQMSENLGKVKLSVLLRMQVPLPSAISLSDSAMKKALHEIQAQISDSCAVSGSIAFFRLVCLSSFKEPFSNSYHFREEFCEVMTYLIDSLTIYSSTITQPLLQLSLVDVALCFAWEHWNSKWCNVQPSVAKPAEDHLGSREYSETAAEPSHANDSNFINDSYEHNYTGLATSILQDTERTIILPDVAIFRLLCNLYLGSPAIAKSVRAQSVYKLSAIFHACASRTQCGQHRELIALLAQAVASAQRDSLKAFFYELLIDILRPHIFCCVENEDLSASESPIYELIFKGLWTDQAPQVREKALKAVLLLSDRFADVKSWIKYMKQTNVEPGLGHVGAPGSWSEYNCE